ncbi:MAG: hypothetical protein HN348_21620 [Proteobacteria bacterium]|jgi:hypothetical protein|nr:hypothetical protein [Pseudomonadota bacterium]
MSKKTKKPAKTSEATVPAKTAKGTPKDEAKPAKAEAKPAKAEAKSAEVEAKSAEAEAKPAKAEAKPAKAEAKPAKAEAKPAKAEAAPKPPASLEDVVGAIESLVDQVIPEEQQVGMELEIQGGSGVLLLVPGAGQNVLRILLGWQGGLVVREWTALLDGQEPRSGTGGRDAVKDLKAGLAALGGG